MSRKHQSEMVLYCVPQGGWPGTLGGPNLAAAKPPEQFRDLGSLRFIVSEGYRCSDPRDVYNSVDTREPGVSDDMAWHSISP